MSFLGQKAQGAQQTDPQRQAYQLSGPVVVPYGLQWIALTHLDEPWNYTVNNEGDKRPQSYWWSYAGLICMGTLKSIEGIRCAGALVYGRFDLTSDVTSINHAWGDYGIRFRVYRGSETQPVDPRLNGVNGTQISPGDGESPNFPNKACPHLHPPYRGMAYVVFDVLCTAWGQGSAGGGGTGIPALEFLVYREPETIVVSGQSRRHGCNPIATVHEWLTNDFWGMGLSADVVPLDAWTAAAQAMAADGYGYETGESGCLSPVLAERSDLARMLTRLFALYDGFLCFEGGQILPGWFPKKGAVDSEALPEITEADLLEPPEITGNNWDDTVSTLDVKFTDYDQELGEATVSPWSALNEAVTGESKDDSLDAPWIHDATQAYRYGQRALADREAPVIEGTLMVRQSRTVDADGRPLLPGRLFHLDYEPHRLDLVCRITERDDQPEKGCRITFRQEPGQFPESYVAPIESVESPDERLPQDLVAIRVWLLPAALRSGAAAEVLPLVQREDSVSTSARVWISANGGYEGEETQLTPLTSWASCGALLTALDGVGTSLHFSTGNGELDTYLSESFGAGDIAAGTMLALVGDEVVIFGALTDAALGERTYTVTRGAYSTTAAAHSLNDPVWLIRRTVLDAERRTHALLVAGSTTYWRFAPTSTLEEGNTTENQPCIIPA